MSYLQKKYKPKYTEEEYENNFITITDESYKLTTKGFNENSTKIKFEGYKTYFRKTWVEIVEMYGKLDELYDYVINEFKKWMNETGKQNIKTFYAEHKYISEGVINGIGSDRIYADCGIRKQRYSDAEIIENFCIIVNTINGVPSFNEFKQFTKISWTAYSIRYKTNIYDNVLKAILSESEYDEYINSKIKENKIVSGMFARHSEDDLRNEFIRVFEYYKENYDTYPSVAMFNDESKICDRTYRSRLKMSWSKVCEYYGYKIDKHSSKAEKITLEMISKLTGCTYIPQKSWNWLIGIGGGKMSVDGYFPDLNLVIEYDGEQHVRPIARMGGEEEFKIRVQNDKLKNTLLKENNINFIRISYKYFNNIDYIKSLLIQNNIPLSEVTPLAI